MIVFSHGFGVDKDSRGLFSDIAAIFGQENCLQFDYNDVNNSDNTITVAPLDIQVEKLQKMLVDIDEPINLICHSQGCLIAALANPVGLQSVLFLAPASTTTSDNFKKVFGDRLVPGKNGEPDMISRKDGTTTLISHAYWDSLDAVGDVEAAYEKIAAHTFLTIITAGNDELVETSFPRLVNKAEIHSLSDADHNFTGESRQKLLNVFRQLGKQDI